MKNNAIKIITPRLIVRKYELRDAESLKEVVDRNVDHLLPWLPWAANEPQSIEMKRELIRGWDKNFEADEDYVYAIFLKNNEQFIGGTGYHTRQGKDILEIGYWMDKNHANKGYITESSYALTKVAFQYLGIEKMEIRCMLENIASGRVPEKLGYLHEYDYRKIEKNEAGERARHSVWTMFKEKFKAIEEYDDVVVYDGAGDLVGTIN